MTHQVLETSCRIGLISRLDFPSDGFRKGLADLAASILAKEDVHFVVLAGGLVDARHVRDKAKKLTKRIKELRKEIKALEKTDDETGDARAERERAERIRELAAKADRFQSYLDELAPERMAEQLAHLLPVFKNKAGEMVKLYIFPSKAYDGEVGEQVAELLAAKLRPDDVRAYPQGDDRLVIKQAGKELEVLVPYRQHWRGEYFSTPAEALIRERARITQRRKPDIYIVGCFGITITKPLGESHRPYVTAPVLHQLRNVRVSENQIGVRVITVYRDRPEPETRNFSLKDLINQEYQMIKLPRDVKPRQRKILEALQEKGECTAGILAEATGLNHSQVNAALEPLLNRDGKRPKGWPGLRFHVDSKRWDFDSYWIREHLAYSPLPTDRKTDSILAFGCLHAGSIYTDYEYFLETVPQAMIDRGATVLVGAGDFVEGTKHGVVMTGEVFGGMNVTTQEKLAGRLLAVTLSRVFKMRFQPPKGKAHPTAAAVMELVKAALPTFIYITGNHDDWSAEAGFTPLDTMWSTMMINLTRRVEKTLQEHGLMIPGLLDIVESKLILLPQETGTTHDFASGLRMGVTHPHMGRTKTTSIRLQEALEQYRDCQLALVANFHVAEHLEMWDGELGQRAVLELGTIKRRSDFEGHKMKTVDFGFGFIQLESVNGRVVASQQTFYGGAPTKALKLNRKRIFQNALEAIGLADE